MPESYIANLIARGANFDASTRLECEGIGIKGLRGIDSKAEKQVASAERRIRLSNSPLVVSEWMTFAKTKRSSVVSSLSVLGTVIVGCW